jgi:hypothetical protein
MAVWGDSFPKLNQYQIAETTCMNRPLTFSIVTPSYRNSEWLKLCIASIQAVVDIEPLVAPATGGTFQPETHELRDLYPAKS